MSTPDLRGSAAHYCYETRLLVNGKYYLTGRLIHFFAVLLLEFELGDVAFTKAESHGDPSKRAGTGAALFKGIQVTDLQEE